MFYEVDKDALALLRAAKEHHDRLGPEEPFSEGTRVAPGLVAERAGLEPETLRYERALRYLVREPWCGRRGSAVYRDSTSTGPGAGSRRDAGLAIGPSCPQSYTDQSR
jgi:hypothetical protein